MLLGISLMPAYAAGPQEQKIVTAMVTSPGHLATMAMDGFADILRKKHPWLRVSVLPTQGYFYNLKVIVDEPGKRTNTIIGNSNPGMRMAKTNTEPFKQGFSGANPKHLWNDYAAILFWATTQPDKIKTVYDLAGKRLAHPPTAGAANIGLTSVLKGAGVFDKLGAITYGSLDNVHDLVLDGKADACAVVTLGNGVTGANVAQAGIVQLSSLAKTFGYVSCGKDKADVARVIANSDIAASHRAVLLPVGSLPKQTREVYGISDDCWVDADASMPEEIAYELVKSKIAYTADLKAYGGLLAISSKEYSCEGAQKNADLWHPGALRAYREAGLIK
jgi:TRAP-type uncharacterized transport system substrate-binding protein